MPQNAWTGLSQATANLPALGMGMVKMQRDEQNKATAIGIAQERNRIAQEHYGVMEANAARQTAAAEAKVPPHLRIANPSGLAPAKLATQKAFGKAGMDALDPVWGLYKDISEKNPGTTMSDVYAAAKSAYPSMREEIAANIQKSLESGKLSPNEQKRMSALYDAVMYDQTGDKVLGEGIFKNTARSIKMEEENSKAAINEAKMAQLEANRESRERIASENRDLKDRLAAEREQRIKENPSKHDSYANRLEKQADNEAARETRMKYPTAPTIAIGPDGKPTISYPNNPEAQQFYLTRKKEIGDAKLRRAVKQKALPNDYLPEAEVPPSTPAPPAASGQVSVRKKIGGGMPEGAQTGTFNGVRAWTTDGKTFYDMEGKKLN